MLWKKDNRLIREPRERRIVRQIPAALLVMALLLLFGWLCMKLFEIIAP